MPRRWVGAIAVALLAVLSVVGPAAAQNTEAVERIAISSLKEKIDSGETLILIDVREDRELEADGAIKGAIHIPMGELDARMADIPKDIELVFY